MSNAANEVIRAFITAFSVEGGRGDRSMVPSAAPTRKARVARRSQSSPRGSRKGTSGRRREVRA